MITKHQSHMPSPKEFDYSLLDRIFNKFPSFCDATEENYVPNSDALRCLLDRKVVDAYLSWCLSQDIKFTKSQLKPSDVVEKVTPDFTNSNVLRYFSEGYVDLNHKEKLMGTLPLSERGYIKAIDTLSKKPEFFRAIQTFEFFMREYVRFLREAASESPLLCSEGTPSVRITFLNAIQELHNGINTNSFSTDFATVFGFHADKEGVNYPAALHHLFSRPSAFSSYSIDPDTQNPKLAKCPFQPAAAAALTTEFDSQTGLSSDRKIAGGILIAIINKYRLIEGNAPTHKPVDP